MDNSPPDGSVTLWLDQLKAGDSEAAGPLWRGYFQQLVSVARGRLRNSSRAARDEEDVALSAFDSFCRGVDGGRFPRLDDRDDLWQVLFVITDRKAAGSVRHGTRAKRGGGTNKQISEIDGAGGSGADLLANRPGVEPSPEYAAQIAEECERLLSLLDDGELRRLAISKMEGYTNAELAEMIDRSIPTVERKLARIRKQWERETPR